MSDLSNGLTPLELAGHVRSKIESAQRYAHGRKHRFRWKSVTVRLTTLVLSAASTIILGLQNLDPWTGTAFSLIAVVTVVAALEPFFAWRSLWVLMEEASYRFHRLLDELEYYVAANEPDTLDIQRVREMHDEYQRIWEKLSSNWLKNREQG
ncbi:SLATT domain-containing protein [Alloactinosynnema sp. L-07]|uniref:SLATT domain-containing protein n=1 Tax=Alloactinosynnema sp. L-07 TaxID=1653480 RepID=UPI00082B575A|nr:SLATT domain-containing protein [Alloactinosynnema sp. L-07]